MIDELLEQLAALEHEQWMEWARSLSESETLSPDRLKRWAEFMVPYDELSEEAKEHDRKWALKVIDLIIDDLLATEPIRPTLAGPKKPIKAEGEEKVEVVDD